MFQVKSSWKLILVQMILAPCWYPRFPSILVYFCVSVFPEELGALLFYRTQNLSVFKHLAVARKQSQRLDVQWRLIALGRWCSRESVCISMMRIMRRSEPCQQTCFSNDISVLWLQPHHVCYISICFIRRSSRAPDPRRDPWNILHEHKGTEVKGKL